MRNVNPHRLPHIKELDNCSFGVVISVRGSVVSNEPADHRSPHQLSPQPLPLPTSTFPHPLFPPLPTQSPVRHPPGVLALQPALAALLHRLFRLSLTALCSPPAAASPHQHSPATAPWVQGPWCPTWTPHKATKPRKHPAAPLAVQGAFQGLLQACLAPAWALPCQRCACHARSPAIPAPCHPQQGVPAPARTPPLCGAPICFRFAFCMSRPGQRSGV